jgi:hypothetical protein
MRVQAWAEEAEHSGSLAAVAENKASVGDESCLGPLNDATVPSEAPAGLPSVARLDITSTRPELRN